MELASNFKVLCSIEATGLHDGVQFGEAEIDVQEPERHVDEPRALEAADNVPALLAHSLLSDSPEHVADVRRRARRRGHDVRSQAHALQRFGRTAAPTELPPTMPNNVAPSCDVLPIIQSRVPRVSQDVSTNGFSEATQIQHSESMTHSQSSLAAERAVELSLLESAAASSQLELEEIGAVLANADPPEMVIGKQLSRESATAEREANELNLAITLSRAEQIQQRARQLQTATAEAEAMERARANSLLDASNFDLGDFTRTASTAFALANSDADMAAEIMLAAGVPARDLQAAADIADGVECQVERVQAEEHVQSSAERYKRFP